MVPPPGNVETLPPQAARTSLFSGCGFLRSAAKALLADSIYNQFSHWSEAHIILIYFIPLNFESDCLIENPLIW
jgi:hypothetical protein